MLFKSTLLLLLVGCLSIYCANAQAGLEQVECLTKYVNDCGKDLKGVNVKEILAGHPPTEVTKEVCCDSLTLSKCVIEKLAADAKCKEIKFTMNKVTECDKFKCGSGAAALSSLSIGFTLFIVLCARVFFH